jgi:hypothetical protein
MKIYPLNKRRKMPCSRRLSGRYAKSVAMPVGRGAAGMQGGKMSDGWAYIARTTVATKRHPDIGTAVAATVDSPDMQKDNAKYIADWIREGLTIERVPVEWIRQHLFTNTPYQP